MKLSDNEGKYTISPEKKQKMPSKKQQTLTDPKKNLKPRGELGILLKRFARGEFETFLTINKTKGWINL